MKISCIVGIVLLFIPVIAEADSLYYEVAEKDTLWSIANKYKVGVDVLMKANKIQDEKTLRVGMELLIPSTYVIKKGDNLWRIAREHQTSVQVLRELNNLKNDEILVGDTLVVPALPITGSSDGTVETAAASRESGSETSLKNDPPIVNNNTLSLPFWPLEGVRSRKTGKISGTEILGSQGDAVISVAAGEVVWNAVSPVFGNIVIIESPGNYLYLYSGLTGTTVNFGERISAGTKIAELGINPHTGEAKLLFSVYKDGELIDPSTAPRG